MIRCILATLLLVAAFASPSFGQDQMVLTKADASYGVKYAEERVVTLPQDQYKPYLTVFGNPADPRYATVKKWFDENETLKSFKDQTHFNTISTSGIDFKDRYAGNTPTDLVVRLQSIDQASPIVELVGNQVPMSAEALARHLNTSASRAECFLRRRNCGPDGCQPQPAPSPNTDPAPQPLPPAGPVKPAPVASAPAPMWPSLVVVGFAAAIGAFLGVRYKWKETHLA